MFKFLTKNEHLNLIDRRFELIDILNKIHGVFYYHTNSENHGDICLWVLENIHNQIMDGNYFTPFDVFNRYTDKYRSYVEQQPGFSEIEFMLLRAEAERSVLYCQL